MIGFERPSIVLNPIEDTFFMFIERPEQNLFFFD